MKQKSSYINHLLKGYPFNSDRHLKWQLSNSYLKDSNDFLWRIGLINENLPYTSSAFLAKMYVDLLMGAECALKSLIISLSKKLETPEQAYIVVRNDSHNLQKLYEEVERRAKRRIKLLLKGDKSLLFKANSLGVGYRYDITTFLFLTQEDFVDRELNTGKVSSVINYEFIIDFYKMLFRLKAIANKSLEKYYRKDSGIPGKRLKSKWNRQNAFFKSMKNKL
jgi:hypothetical protein